MESQDARLSLSWNISHFIIRMIDKRFPIGTIVLDLARYSYAEIPGRSDASGFARWTSECPKREISRDRPRRGKGEKDQGIVRSGKKRNAESS